MSDIELTFIPETLNNLADSVLTSFPAPIKCTFSADSMRFWADSKESNFLLVNRTDWLNYPYAPTLLDSLTTNFLTPQLSDSLSTYRYDLLSVDLTRSTIEVLLREDPESPLGSFSDLAATYPDFSSASCLSVTATIDSSENVTGTGTGQNATEWRVIRVSDGVVMDSGSGTSASFSFTGEYGVQYQLQFR